ncbi:MAG: hypothetical protein ACE5HP_08545 [Gemmatimonadota bacterium]
MSAEGKDVAADVRGLDPWGLRRVEQLLQTVEGVDSLKIVPDGRGGIDEIHVLSGAGLGAKQIVRNIESALLAQFGLQVDHRKISVAQVRERELPAAAAEPPPEPAAAVAAERRFLLDSFQLERKAGKRVACAVRLRDGDKVFEGEAEGPDYARSRLEVTARAVLSALEQVLEGAAFAVEGVAEVELFGRRIVVALIHGLAGRNAVTLPGISRIHDSQEEAVVLACLNATNRWVASL